MDKLLQPDTGLIVWTVVTFLLLVLVLTKTAWKPILESLDKREGKIRGDLERAESAQREADLLRQKYETQLADAQKRMQEMIQQARSEGEKTKDELVALAKEQSKKILERGRDELKGETDRLRGQLKEEVADLSLAMAEKILQRSVDKKIRETVFNEALDRMKEVKK